jgi:glycogen debranching enzyme
VHITVNEDTAFFIADESGDVLPGTEQGLYEQDTRFLSRYVLTVDGHRPRTLATRGLEHFHAVHLLANPGGDNLEAESLTLVRHRLVGEGLHEDLELRSYVDRPLTLRLDLTVSADFLHIFEVRGHARPRSQREGPPNVVPFDEGRGLRLLHADGRDFPCTEVRFTRPAEFPAPNVARFEVALPARGTWRLCVDVAPRPTADAPIGPLYSCQRPPAHPPARGDTRLEHAPRLQSDSYVLQEAYEQAMRDLLALHFPGRHLGQDTVVLAAGIPWFMALFGRDSLIAAYQALPYFPDVATGVLRALARLQGQKINPRTEEQPGKILHEHRPDALLAPDSPIPAFPYYGTVDATPLFLIVLAETYRHTGNRPLVAELWPAARRALDWLSEYGDRDGDGFLEYVRSTDEGLVNQGWKDSWDGIRFRDGTVAKPPIALCEVQGYAYAARLAMAELAEVMGEGALATTLRADARALADRFDAAFWLPDRGYYAIALDGAKRPVTGLASNAGQALWSGIVPPERAPRLAEVLLGPELFSGWGVRTMGAAEGGYNPVGYHTGTVWPHDNSLIAAGLARYGLTAQAGQLITAQLASAARLPQYRLPELFGGYGREEYGFVVEYPVACSPQAWAAGAVLLYVTTLLGLAVDVPNRHIRLRPFLPRGINRLCLTGIRVGSDTLDVELVRELSGVEARLLAAPRDYRIEGAIWRDSPFW